MSSSNYTNSITAVIAAGAIFIQSGAFIYFIRKFKRLQYELNEVLNDCNALRDELSWLKNRVGSLEGQTKSVRFASTEQPPQCIVSRVDSLASSEYVSANEDWDADDRTALLIDQYVDETIEMKEADTLHEQGEYNKSYDILRKANDSNPNNVEILWRLARACHNVANTFDQRNPRRKELIFEGHKYAIQAYNLDQKNFPVLKWAAVLSGGLTDYLGMKQKIEEGYKFKIYLDKGLELNPKEYTLLHMRGRFKYSVANLSWLERKAASAFFATPPIATIDEALMDFLEVEKLRPAQWLDNLVYIGRCYIAKGNKSEAAKYLKLAQKIEPADDADRETLEEVKRMLNTVSK